MTRRRVKYYSTWSLKTKMNGHCYVPWQGDRYLCMIIIIIITIIIIIIKRMMAQIVTFIITVSSRSSKTVTKYLKYKQRLNSQKQTSDPKLLKKMGVYYTLLSTDCQQLNLIQPFTDETYLCYVRTLCKTNLLMSCRLLFVPISI
jgi:c-di-AMP phosphodiesterase-like protein